MVACVTFVQREKTKMSNISYRSNPFVLLRECSAAALYFMKLLHDTQACQDTEVHFKPFVTTAAAAIIIIIRAFWISEPPLFSWELHLLSMSCLVHLSALAALGLTPEVEGHRITGSTMPQIVDC